MVDYVLDSRQQQDRDLLLLVCELKHIRQAIWYRSRVVPSFWHAHNQSDHLSGLATAVHPAEQQCTADHHGLNELRDDLEHHLDGVAEGECSDETVETLALSGSKGCTVSDFHNMSIGKYCRYC